MGGLAFRACIMQNPEDIIGLVTAGTPHGGSFLAYSPRLKNNMRYSGKASFISLSYVLDFTALSEGIFLSSGALTDVAPDSPQMIKMYNQTFPKNILTLILPVKPRNSYEASLQLDNSVNILATAFDAYTLYDIQNVFRTGASPTVSGLTGLGVPGFFSVSPVPVKDNKGRLCLPISGRLAEIFAPFAHILSPTYNVPHCKDGHCEL